MSLRCRAIRLIALVAARYGTGSGSDRVTGARSLPLPVPSVNRDNEKRGHWRGHDAAKEDCKTPFNSNTQEQNAVDEISPFAPQERGTTLAYKVWNETSFVKDAEEDERL